MSALLALCRVTENSRVLLSVSFLLPHNAIPVAGRVVVRVLVTYTVMR